MQLRLAERAHRAQDRQRFRGDTVSSARTTSVATTSKLSRRKSSRSTRTRAGACSTNLPAGQDATQRGGCQGTLAKLAAAAAKDDENLMPYLVDCCHAYATVGEMVECLKNHWGEFKEPVPIYE